VLLTAGLAWIVVIAAPDVAYPVMLAPVIISGAGFAMALPADIKAVIGSVPPADIGKASATFSTMRQLGGAFGVAILAAVFADGGSYASAASFSNGFAAATAAAAGLAMAGAICRCAHRSPSISILLRVSLPRTFLEGKKKARVSAVLRLGRKQREACGQDVPDRAGGVALDVRQQVLGLPVLLAFCVDDGVEVLLGRCLFDSRSPPCARSPVDGRDLHTFVGESFQVETSQG